MTDNPDKPDRLVGRIELSAPVGSFLGDVRIRLLEMIAEHRSITQAARHVPMSYKAAWDAVDAMNNLSPQPLVERSAGGRQGGGSSLTPWGRQLVTLFRALERQNQHALDRLLASLDPAADAVPQRFHRLLRLMDLRTSARNQFACRVVSLSTDRVGCEVVLSMADDDERSSPRLISTITREAADELGLAPGGELMALVKASAVMVIGEPDARVGARNHLSGTVARLERSDAGAEVVLDIGRGKSVTALVSADAADELELRPGRPACAVFKASSVVLVLV